MAGGGGLRHPIEPYAREAFAAGWAASGGPLTHRVRAGCDTAVRLAVEHADDPRILEVTVDLGRLEGMWARLFHRRTDLISGHTASATAVWRRMADALAVGVTVAALWDRLTDSPDEDVELACAVAAAALVRTLSDSPDWAELRTTIEAALLDGRAEGMVATVGIAADRGARRLDWETAFTDARALLKRLGITVDTDRWMRALIDRITTDVRRALVLAAAASDTVDAATDTIRNLFNTAGALGFVIDWAMTAATADGQRDILRTQGAAEVSVITVGDARVCAACEDAEARSPWPLSGAPDLPIHPWCRCVYSGPVDPDSFPAWFT